MPLTPEYVPPRLPVELQHAFKRRRPNWCHVVAMGCAYLVISIGFVLTITVLMYAVASFSSAKAGRWSAAMHLVDSA
jgi:hypothetical protein